jgi:muramoyltetrapeptide carboxypeptidase
MIAPPALKPGDKVALLAPARWPTESQITGLEEALERHGLVPFIHPQIREKSTCADGRVSQLAGDDDRRAAAFNEMLRDPSIKAICFPRAGTGSYRILDKIDYEAARKNPKIIFGFSDVDIVLVSIMQKSDVITFRGPMGVNFSVSDADPRTEQECFEVLTGSRNEWTWDDVHVLKEGTAEGILVGGNLAVLNANIGTPYECDTKDKIVIVEECDELLFRLDRFLYQASRAGKFDTAKAVLFATVENMLDGEQHDGSGNPFGKNVEAMLKDFVPPHIPLGHGLPLGHDRYLSTHPLGARVHVELKGTSVKMRLLEPAVSV